jgi:hypothetical protein
LVDWDRVERHILYGRIAQWARIIAMIAMVDEVYSAISYHFPLWDDIAMPLTFAVHQVACFVQKHTAMYRIDL